MKVYAATVVVLGILFIAAGVATVSPLAGGVVAGVGLVMFGLLGVEVDE